MVPAKLYDRKTPITAAEILNDRVVPFYDEHGIPLSRVLTNRPASGVAKPAAHTRVESRGSPRTRAAQGERQTRRWREMDSNHRSPGHL